MCLLDQPPAKMLRGRHRWHVLLKLTAGPAAEALCGALTELGRETEPPPGGETFFEYNPVTMM